MCGNSLTAASTPSIIKGWDLPAQFGVCTTKDELINVPTYALSYANSWYSVHSNWEIG